MTGSTSSGGPTPMALLVRLAAVLFAAAIPLLIVTSTIRFFASEVRFYERGFREHNAARTTGIALNELERAAAQLVAYFADDAGELRLVVDQGGQEVALFDERETRHLKDVKGLMRVVFRLQELTLAYALAYVAGTALWVRGGSLRGLARNALAGAAAGLALLVLLGGLAAAGFDAAWTRFHQLAFRNDFWELDPDTDHLIQMFPEEFWQEATFIVAGLSALQLLVVAALSAAWLLLGRQDQGPDATPVRAGAGTADSTGKVSGRSRSRLRRSRSRQP